MVPWGLSVGVGAVVAGAVLFDSVAVPVPVAEAFGPPVWERERRGDTNSRLRQREVLSSA